MRAVDLEREERRVKAIQLLSEGLNQLEVARILGVTHQAVNNWVGQYRREGLAGLRKRPFGLSKAS